MLKIASLISSMCRKNSIIRKLLNFYFKFRTFWILNFDRTKLKQSLLERQEKSGIDCAKCGACCLENGCKAFDKKTKLCKIWKYADFQCKAGMFFWYELEFRKEVKKVCKYSWKDKDKKWF